MFIVIQILSSDYLRTVLFYSNKTEELRMAKVMDPRIEAIMAQYDTPPSEEKSQAVVPVENAKPKPPTNYEEFMKVEGLVKWKFDFT